MATGNIKTGGSWHTITSQAIKVAGSWKNISTAFIKVSGVWVIWFAGFFSDTFNRTTTGSLGTSSSGGIWKALRGVWYSNNGVAQSDTAASGYPAATTDSKSLDNTIYINSMGYGPGILFWGVDSANWFGIYQDRTDTYTAPASVPASYTPASYTNAVYVAPSYSPGSGGSYNPPYFRPAQYYNGTDSVYHAATPAYYSPSYYSPSYYYPPIYSPPYYDPGVYAGAYYNASYNYYQAPYYRPASYRPAQVIPAYYNPGGYRPAVYTPATSAYFIPPTYPSYTPSLYIPGSYTPGSPGYYNPGYYTPASYNPAVYTPAYYNAGGTTSTYSLKFIKSVSNTVTNVATQALTAAAKGIKVVTRGLNITATAYTDDNFTTTAGTSLSSNISQGTAVGLSMGIIIAPSTSGQTNTIDSFNTSTP